MSSEDYAKLSESEKAKEDWMNSKWRPMCGWIYILVCIFDFVIFPILWSILQALSKGQVNMQWQPITLQGAGLFHMSMGVIIGVSAYGRTQEKLNGANNGGLQLPTAVGSTYTPPPPIGQPAAVTLVHQVQHQLGNTVDQPHQQAAMVQNQVHSEQNQ